LTRIAQNISNAIRRIIATVANSMNFEKKICKDTIVTCIKIKMRCFFFRRSITSSEWFAICITRSWKMSSS
jgi:hypothetical protein